MVSRQRLWQIRQQEEGKCMRCEKKIATGSKFYCEKHRKQAAKKQRDRYRTAQGIPLDYELYESVKNKKGKL